MKALPAVLPDNVHVFERGWLSSNNVLMLGRHETTLVDSGYLIHAPLRTSHFDNPAAWIMQAA